jgi:hypothetical protein
MCKACGNIDRDLCATVEAFTVPLAKRRGPCAQINDYIKNLTTGAADQLDFLTRWPLEVKAS